MSRKSKQLNKLKKIGLQKNIYSGVKEKEFSKLIASPSNDISLIFPSQILKYMADELLNEFIHRTGPTLKGLYGDLQK